MFTNSYNFVGVFSSWFTELDMISFLRSCLFIYFFHEVNSLLGCEDSDALNQITQGQSLGLHLAHTSRKVLHYSMQFRMRKPNSGMIFPRVPHSVRNGHLMDWLQNFFSLPLCSTLSPFRRVENKPSLISLLCE